MNIERKQELKKSILFKNLIQGEVFTDTIFNARIYLKTSYNGNVNCIRLETGNLYFIDPDEPIHHIIGKFVEE